mgnify:CR=1 FL=1
MATDRKNAGGGRIVELDVRSHLRNKLEPFQLIMDAVKTVGPLDTFVLHATFKPTPLLGLMKMKGFAHRAERLAADHWKVTFVPKRRKHELGEGADEADDPAETPAPGGRSAGASGDSAAMRTDDSGDPSTGPEPWVQGPRTIELDNRGLTPPQPMVRTLKALEQCRPGDRVVIHNDRVPVFLLEELNALGYPYRVEQLPDGSARVTIEKK